MVARQGFATINENPFSYHQLETGPSCAVGIDSGDLGKFKIFSLIAGTAIFTITEFQFSIDPAANGNVVLRPNGSGTTSIKNPTLSGTFIIPSFNAGVMRTSTLGNVFSDNGTSGQVLIGGDIEPQWANITSTDTSVTITNGLATIDLSVDVISTLTGDSGGAVSATNFNVDLLGGDLIETVGNPGSSNITFNLVNGTDGQLIIASTAGAPEYANALSTDGTITITEGSNSLDLEVTATRGTWTPVLTFGGGSTGITYDTQFGDFYSSGDVVTINMIIELTSKGTSTGVMEITGLPISAANLTVLNFRFSNIDVMNPNQVVHISAFAVGTSIFIDAITDNSTPDPATDASFEDDTILWIGGSYLV